MLPHKQNHKMVLHRGHNKKSYKNRPKSFHPLHFTILSQTWFALFSTKTIKKPSDLSDFMFTTCSTLASYKHGHITYLKRHLPATFKICFIPYKSYKGTWPGLSNELTNQLLCFHKWISLCYVIHNNTSIYWGMISIKSEVPSQSSTILYVKVHRHVLIQT